MVHPSVLFHARERRRSLAGVPELFRTHRIGGVTTMPVATIDTDGIFPDRTRPVTFRTKIRILANAGQHRGLVFELGGATRGAVLWVQDDGIGFGAGGANASGEEAVALYDVGLELPPGLVLDLVAAIRPGDGLVRLWGNGTELARGEATSGGFNGTWSGLQNESFASAPATDVPAYVPATSRVAPAGFDVIEALSAYFGQVPRHFV